MALLAKAIYPFKAEQAGDLSFNKGDMITVLEQNVTGWWKGQSTDGRVGIFPHNRVELIEGSRPLPPLDKIERLGAVKDLEKAMVISRVDHISVSPNELANFASTLAFVVEASTSDGKKVSATKSMKDFRALNHGLNTLRFGKKNPSGSEVEVFDLEIPEWADSVLLDKNQQARRCSQLGAYLDEAIGEALLDYFIILWLDPNCEFNLAEDQKSLAQRTLKDSFKYTVETYGKKDIPELARVAYKWAQRDDQEINLIKNEVIAVLNKDTKFAGWWMGQKSNGKTGLFPFNYVQVLPQDVAKKVVNPSSGSPVILPPSPKKEKLPAKDVKVDVIVNERFKGASLSVDGGKGRNRKRIIKYSLCCVEAFDELLQDGITVEENGKLAKFAGRSNTPKVGDEVSLHYSAYIWEPQKQELLEYASSDELFKSTSKKAQHNEIFQSGPMTFTIGSHEIIEGVEETVQRMEIDQSVRVTMTPDKAYGDVGMPPIIPGNSYLVFDLTLKEIKRKTNAPNKGKLKAGPNNGAGKSFVALRKPSGGFKDFQGFKSMQDMRALNQAEHIMQSKRRLNDKVGSGMSLAMSNTGVDIGVDAEAFKKKLTLKKLQEIVRERRYEEYGIVPGIIEEYLTDDEFQKAFNVDHYTWLLMPAYKRNLLKQQLGLF